MGRPECLVRSHSFSGAELNNSEFIALVTPIVPPPLVSALEGPASKDSLTVLSFISFPCIRAPESRSFRELVYIRRKNDRIISRI